MIDNIIDNRNNINNSSNEVLNVYTINKNLEKLYENDEKLNQFKNNIKNKKILSYSDGYSYDKNDIVYFQCTSPITNKKELFFLKSIISDNIHKPVAELINGKISFENSGWYDVQDFQTYMQNDISNYIHIKFDERFSIEHQNNSSYHKYGSVTENNLSSLLLFSDMSNIDKDRQYIHYPYQTITLSTNDVVLDGYYRKWDCGILEYNILFQLGYTGNKVMYNGVQFNEVKCNTLELSGGYVELSDAQIFHKESDSSDDYVYLNDTAETNHDKFVNSYSSKIVFPEKFKDDKYMIFESHFRNYCQNIKEKQIDYNPNSLIYANKLPESIEPVYITFQKNEYTESALVLNKFHCQIIGRWK